MNKQALRQWCQSNGSIDRAVIDSTGAFQSRPLIMGVINMTPNSFSDGGVHLDKTAACQRARIMIEQGVDVIDLGGEASNPGSQSVSLDEELSRVIPVIQAIQDESDIAISIDTCKAEVMQAAVEAGASMINDIKALTGPNALNVANTLQVPVCLMHMNGTPETMQDFPHYEPDVVTAVDAFFQSRLEACTAVGMPRSLLFLDPGIGFGKSTQHNLFLLRNLRVFQKYDRPLLLGISRKRVIGDVLKRPVSERLIGGVASAVYAAMQGVKMIRTHDVDETYQALRMIEAIYNANEVQWA